MNNLLSLFFGLVAWALPIAALIVKKHRTLLCCSSLSLCVLSLLMQLREIKHRSGIGDFAAIEDTINAVFFCAGVLVAVTLALNLLAMIRRRKNP